jgi:hypothetical protein
MLPRVVISCVDALKRHFPTEPHVLVDAAAGRRDAGAKHPVTRSRTTSLLPPPSLALHAAPSISPAT